MKTHWEYHKTNAIMLFRLKNMAQNSLDVDFWWCYLVFEGFKDSVKYCPLIIPRFIENLRNVIIFDHKLLLREYSTRNY